MFLGFRCQILSIFTGCSLLRVAHKLRRYGLNSVPSACGFVIQAFPLKRRMCSIFEKSHYLGPQGFKVPECHYFAHCFFCKLFYLFISPIVFVVWRSAPKGGASTTLCSALVTPLSKLCIGHQRQCQGIWMGLAVHYGFLSF